MTLGLTRREWLLSAPAAALLSGGLAATAPAQETAPPTAGAPYPEYPSQHPDRVREVVGASHFNIDRVREIVTATPALAKAAWDWGFGDWETALGAASHVGRRDIAELLIAHGARPDLFTFTLLGKLEAVRAAVDASPGIQRIHGPHGITLLQHAKSSLARNDDEPAQMTVAFLESLGDADQTATNLPITEQEQQVYLGRYAFGPRDDEHFEVLIHPRAGLSIKRADNASRALHRVEEHGFAPVGAPNVRIRFRVDAGRAVSLTVHDSNPLVTVRRGE